MFAVSVSIDQSESWSNHSAAIEIRGTYFYLPRARLNCSSNASMCIRICQCFVHLIFTRHKQKTKKIWICADYIQMNEPILLWKRKRFFFFEITRKKNSLQEFYIVMKCVCLFFIETKTFLILQEMSRMKILCSNLTFSILCNWNIEN